MTESWEKSAKNESVEYASSETFYKLRSQQAWKQTCSPSLQQI